MLSEEVMYGALKFTGNCSLSLFSITGDWFKFLLELLPYICSNVLDIIIHATFNVIKPLKIHSE